MKTDETLFEAFKRQRVLRYDMYLFLDCAVGVEDGELVEVDDVLARLRVALGEDGHAAGDRAARLGDQRLHRVQAAAGGDDLRSQRGDPVFRNGTVHFCF